MQDIPSEVYDFAHEVGNFIEYWGFKRVQGQIWAHLYLSEEPLDTQELLRRTSVSKGLISIYLKEMLHYKVIQESHKGAKGTTFYVASTNQDQVIFNVLRMRERKMISRVHAAWEQCMKIPDNEAKAAKLNKKNLKESGAMINNAGIFLDLIVRSQKPIRAVVDAFKQCFKGLK